jgi:radical SAM protein (TIGR04043 family)
MDALTLKTNLLINGINQGESICKNGRKGGAGPAGACIEVHDFLVNVPTFDRITSKSPLKLINNNIQKLEIGGERFPIRQIPKPDFYDMITSDGTPMKKIALLHGKDTLATTLYQKCYLNEVGMGCGFCAIETSLRSGSTILRKTPAQMEEVTKEAMKEGVNNMVITTGSPNPRDHGAEMIAETVQHLKNCFDLSIHVQLTPPQTSQLELIFNAGADTIGLHIESFDHEILKKVCPGKSHIDFMGSLKFAVSLFGENQVSSFVLGGMGEDPRLMNEGFEDLASLGVIPYLVPFRPLLGTELEGSSTPDPSYIRGLYVELASTIKRYGIDIKKNLAGCVKCGACSSIDVALRSRG